MNLVLLNNIAFCTLSLFLYIFSPKIYSYSFCFFIFLLSIFVSFIYLIRSVKYEGMGFSYFFIFSFIMVNFIYPVFYFNSNNRYFLSFNYGFNENVISQSTALAFVALNFFILFNTSYKKMYYKKIEKIKINKYVVYFLSLFLLMLFLSFIYMGGYSQMFLTYNNGELGYSGINNYLFMLINFFTILLAIIGLHIDNKKIKYITLFFSLSSCFLFLLTGYRSLFISIILIIFCYYNLNFRRVKLYESFIPIFIGGLGMYFIMLNRVGLDFEYHNVLDMFSDLIINNWSLYVLVDYTSNSGSVYWMNFIPQIASILPFSGVLLNFFDMPLYYSYGQFPTYLTFGNNPPLGLGTNMVGEAFLAANIIGVIIVFSLVGILLKKLSDNLNKNIFINIIFLYFVSQSIFLPRVDFGWPIKAIAWMLFTYLILNFMLNKLSVKKK